MSYPYVAAYYDYGLRTRPVLALVIHVAEGGNTVAYLAKDNPNRVSVHYVVERTGRIVQMLRENRISGSLRPSSIRTTDDKPFTSPDGDMVIYGATVARAVMGQFWSDPNTAVLSVEVEGFAANGPNQAQQDALARLVTDLRTRYPRMGLLAHRDFADYKACPGKLMPWGRLGGHGIPLPDSGTEDDMEIEAKHERWLLDGGPGRVTTVGAPVGPDGKVDYTRRLALTSGTGDTNRRYRLIARSRLSGYDGSLDEPLYRALASYAMPVEDCTAEVAAAVAADRAKARVTWE